MCVCRGVSVLARPVPGGSCWQTGGLPWGQRVCSGGAGGKAAGRALRWRRNWLWVACGALPGTGSLSRRGGGGCTLGSQRGLRGPVCRACGFWPPGAGGRARPRQVPHLQSGQQRVLSGRACLHVFVSESGSCVCLRSPAVLGLPLSQPRPAWHPAPRAVSPAQGGRGWGLRPGAVGGKESQTSGLRTLSLRPSRQMASAAPSASVTSPKPLRGRVCGFKSISQVVGLRASVAARPCPHSGGLGLRSGCLFTCPLSLPAAPPGAPAYPPAAPPPPCLWALPASLAPLPCCCGSDGTVGSFGVCGPL